MKFVRFPFFKQFFIKSREEESDADIFSQDAEISVKYLNDFQNWLHQKILFDNQFCPSKKQFIFSTPSLLTLKTIFLFPSVFDVYKIDFGYALIAPLLMKKFGGATCYTVECAGQYVEVVPFKFDQAFPLELI